MKNERALVKVFGSFLCQGLNLKFPVKVTAVKNIKFKKDECYGLYSGDELSNGVFDHSVKWSRELIKTPTQLFAVMAHEYVHAWQMENGYSMSHGGKGGFDVWIRYFKANYRIDIVNMCEV